MFGWDDFGKDGKKIEKKIREKIVEKCVWLEGGGKEKTIRDQLFSLQVHQITISSK